MSLLAFTNIWYYLFQLEQRIQKNTPNAPPGRVDRGYIYRNHGRSNTLQYAKPDTACSIQSRPFFETISMGKKPHGYLAFITSRRKRPPPAIYFLICHPRQQNAFRNIAKEDGATAFNGFAYTVVLRILLWRFYIPIERADSCPCRPFLYSVRLSLSILATSREWDRGVFSFDSIAIRPNTRNACRIRFPERSDYSEPRGISAKSTERESRLLTLCPGLSRNAAAGWNPAHPPAESPDTDCQQPAYGEGYPG